MPNGTIQTQKKLSLLIKANRQMGIHLLERKLIGIGDLEKANALFLPRLHSDQLTEISLLKILLFDTNALREEDFIAYQLKSDPLGYCPLANYRIKDEIFREKELTLAPCQTTWTIPFDCVSGFWFLATAYYPSQTVRQYWSGLLKGPMIWHVASMTALSNAFEGLGEFLDVISDSPEPGHDEDKEPVDVNS